MEVAIVDDEMRERKMLSDKVTHYAEKARFPCRISTYSSGLELLSATQVFDLIFLDIQMQPISGMQTAEKLRAEGNNSFIVFVTVLQEYVYDAFAVQASDYLLKPVQDNRFSQMMGRVCGRIQQQEKSSLLLPSRGNSCLTILLQDILYCEAINHRTSIHTKAETQETSVKIEELALRLGDQFFKCHRSYLVNLDFVCGYKDGLALLENGEKIPVSRLRGQEFSMKMLQYLKKKGC